MLEFVTAYLSIGLRPAAHFLLYDGIISMVLLAPRLVKAVREPIDAIALRLGTRGVDQRRLSLAALVFAIVHAAEAAFGAAAAA